MNKRFFAEFAKTEEQDDGTIKVWGIASTPNTDADGERVTADAMATALPDYMKFGAVREMHQPKAAGTAVEAEVDANGVTQFCAHIVDAEAVKKVQAKVYKGFSIGGKVLARDENDPDTITSIKLVEVSLVDRPANPEAILTMFKAEDAAPDAAAAETGDAISQLVDLVKSAELPASEMVRVLTDAIAKAKGDAQSMAVDPAEAEKAPDIEEKAEDCDDEDDEKDHADEEDDKDMADTGKSASVDETLVGIDVIVRAAQAQGLKKGLRGLNALSAAIYQLVAVQAGVKREQEEEGDNSPVPGQIEDAIKDLLETLVQMAQEETGELVDDLDQAGMESAVPEYGSYSLQCADKVLTLAKRNYSSKQRQAMASNGEAMSDGSFPIKNKTDLENAIRAYGRAKDKPKAKAHIIARAKALGLSALIPDDWKSSDKAEGSSDLGKSHLSEALAKLGRMEVENAALAKRVKELEDMPAPPKGPRRRCRSC